MGSDLIRALCVLAVFVLPLGIAWFIVSHHENRVKGAAAAMSTLNKATLR